jgi:hypothetical protein
MTKPMHAVWVWRRWTRWPLTPSILVVAATVIALDVITAWRDASIGSLGRVAMSPALPLGIVLACMVGLRRLGLDRANFIAWREFLAATGAVLVFGIWAYSDHIGGFEEAIGLVRRNWRNPEDWGLGPGVVAMLASGIVFMFLPGHVAQMSSATRALPFAALGIILAYAVLRTGALLPAVMTHALLNLVTIAALTGNRCGRMACRLRRGAPRHAHLCHGRRGGPARNAQAHLRRVRMAVSLLRGAPEVRVLTFMHQRVRDSGCGNQVASRMSTTNTSVSVPLMPALG